MKGAKEKEHTEIDATVRKGNARSVTIGGEEASEAKECDVVGVSFRPFGYPGNGQQSVANRIERL